MWPKHFQQADHDDNLSARQLRQIHETDVKIRSDDKEWKILSYYYSKDDKCYVIDIEEKNSTYEEGWNSYIENLFEGGNNKRSDGNRQYQKGWDACKKCKNPDWL